MKIKNTNSIQKIRNYIFFPILALATLFIFSLNLHSSVLTDKTGVSQQEKISVKGKIVDANADGIDGVLVKDKNSDIETQTDSEGKFTLSLNKPTVLHFVKLGFQAIEKEIAESDSNLVVMMTPESNELLAKGFEIEKKANKDTQWKLDSLSSLVDQYPLYIIDEIQKGTDFNIKLLNPDEVMSIEVLKDSIAKGVYGVDGESGAVKITTKNFNDLINQVPMQLNKPDTAASYLKKRYEMYKDTMNARNKRLYDRNKKKLY